MSLHVVQQTIKLWCEIGDVMDEPKKVLQALIVSPTQVKVCLWYYSAKWMLIIMQFLLTLLAHSPDLYLDELANELEAQHGV